MGFTYHVSWLLNFFVTTFPNSSPSRSAILWDKSWWELPLKILIFGIFSCSGAWRCARPRASGQKVSALQQRLPFEKTRGWCVGQIILSWCWIPLLGERLPYLSAIVHLSGLQRRGAVSAWWRHVTAHEWVWRALLYSLNPSRWHRNISAANSDVTDSICFTICSRKVVASCDWLQIMRWPLSTDNPAFNVKSRPHGAVSRILESNWSECVDVWLPDKSQVYSNALF